jgi:prepilin-type N-terminal cleavage/methylation domain-containing protein
MKASQNGFTIIELMIATAIFSLMLVLTTTTIIGISQTYIKGSVEGQTQQTARAVLSDISQAVEFNNNSDITVTTNYSGDVYYFCTGSDVYVYQLDKYLSPTLTGNEYSTWALVRFPYSSCTVPLNLQGQPDPLGQTGAEELLATNERLGWLYIVPTAINGETAYTINLEVGYGDNDLLNDTTNTNGNYDVNASPAAPPVSAHYKYQCQSGPDSSFCATSTLTTTVVPRIPGING